MAVCTSTCVTLVFHFSRLRCSSASLCSFVFSKFWDSCASSPCWVSAYSLLWNSPKTLAIPFLDVVNSPLSFFTFGMGVVSFQILCMIYFWCLWIPSESVLFILDVSLFLLSPIQFFLTSCSILSVCVLSVRDVSHLLSVADLFIFVFLRLRHSISSLCFFFGCCCGGCGFHIKSSIRMLGLCGPSKCVSIQMESTTSLTSSCSDSATSLPDLVSTAAAVFVSSFQWGNAMTPASTTPSACSVIFQDSVISCFCVVAAVSASWIRHSVFWTC